MIPRKTIEELIVKHSSLEKELSSGEIDKKLFAEKSKEYSDINEIIDIAKKYINFENDKLELNKILEDQGSDNELRELSERLPSNSSKDYGKPFKEIFENYDKDFYKIDGSLFSPAAVIINSMDSGKTLFKYDLV